MALASRGGAGVGADGTDAFTSSILIAVPDSIAIDIAGPGIVATAEGLPATLFSPDGYADPAVLHLDDGTGRAFTIAIEPATSRPRVIEGRIDARDLVSR